MAFNNRPRKRKSTINEASCTTELVKSFKKKGHFLYKIPDGLDMTDRPFDCTGCVNGKAIAIECKFQRDFRAFGMRSIRESQIRCLNEFEAANGQAFICLFIRGNLEGLGYFNRVIFFTWKEFKEYTGKQNSYKKEVLLNYNYNLGSKGIYNLDKFFELLTQI